MNEVPIIILFCTKIPSKRAMIAHQENLNSNIQDVDKVVEINRLIQETKTKFKFFRNIHVMSTNNDKVFSKIENAKLEYLEINEDDDHAEFLNQALAAMK